jgi:hypothetical protein
LRYRCLSHHEGRKCAQASVRATGVEDEVVEILKKLKPPADWRKRIISAMGELLGDQKLDERIKEIKTVIERMDFRWDHGFIADQNAYLEERIKLQQELEKLTPIADDDLEIAADILTNFTDYWNATNGDRQKQFELIKLIVARVWVKDGHVTALSLRANYHVAVGINETSTVELVDADEKKGTFYTNGADGARTRDLPRDRRIC